MEEPASVAVEEKRHKLAVILVPVLISAFAGVVLFAWFFIESGYHFYWAEGMTERQAIARYGEPERREKGIHDGADYLRYYTGFLNFVDLRVEDGKVTQVEITPDD